VDSTIGCFYDHHHRDPIAFRIFDLAAGAGRLVLKASAKITGRVQSDLVVI